VISLTLIFLLFTFWCLDAEGGEESIYLCRLSIFYSNLACKTTIMCELVMWTWP
jgi:hypothetical protein